MLERSIYSIFSGLAAENIERNDFNYLVESVLKIAKGYVFHNRTRLTNFFNEENGLHDLAIDAISSLFIKNGENKFPICKSFEEWSPAITNNEEAIFFLNKLTACRVEQHISKCLKESDPVFAKILDSLNYTIKKYNYNKIRILGQVFVVKDFNSNFSNDVITYDDLNQIPMSIFEDNDTLFEKLFEYLELNTDFMAAIPLNALTTRIKYIQTSNYFSSNESSNIESMIHVNEIIFSALDKTFTKLDKSYYEKNKLNELEIKSFKLALKDMAHDISHGSNCNGISKYLFKHMSELDQESYQKMYHNTLEYLLKFMRNEIKVELAKNYNTLV